MRVRTLAILLPWLVAACDGSQRAPHTASTGAVAAPPAEAAASVSQPELVAFKSGERTLHGFLYRPEGAGPHPAIVFNHGSEPVPTNLFGQALFYVPHGFVLFVPHRRGQGESRDAGEYIMEITMRAGDDPNVLVREMDAHADDVMAAVKYVASLPYVDPRRVAVAGCSFGGIQALLAAERGDGIAASVDFAGAAIMWSKTPPLQERMKRAARAARVPVFFIQAENDYDTSPSLVLGAEMRAAGRPSKVHIFPPKGSTPKDGHGFCMGGREPPWGDEVLAFLHENMH
jgi:dipeptidyl aminopeptidase/acylaminoacyl peptidase